MKIKKFLEKMADRLDPDERRSSSRKGRIKAILKSLKQQRKELERQLEAEGDPHKQKKLETEIAIVQAQRKKGLKALKILKKRKKG